MAKIQTGLGRGLGALISDVNSIQQQAAAKKMFVRLLTDMDFLQVVWDFTVEQVRSDVLHSLCHQVTQNDRFSL